jgi:transcriptional regulator with XRE-family HTH domain
MIPRKEASRPVMTDPSANPLAFFAAELKRLRSIAGMTQEQLAEATTYSPSLVAAIETCRRIPSDDFAERADKALGTDGILARLQALVESTAVLPWFKDLVEVERRATEIRIYETYVIPGLLQTEDYARCSIGATRPVITAEEIDRAVALRMTRQETLYREDDPPRLWVILDESVLYRVNGGHQVMREQLQHLTKASEQPNIVVQVIPNSEGSTSAGGRNFILLTLRSDPAMAYLEDIRSARYLRKPDDVVQYSLTYDHLRSNALSDMKSAALIKEVAKRYER